MKLLLYTFILILLPMPALSQVDSNKWNLPNPDHYSFIKYDGNALVQHNQLDSIYHKLFEIRKTHQGNLTIIHIGDSHLQADMITSVLRNGFHEYFGDAGRGLVFPYQLAGSNAPHDIHSSSNITWHGNRLTIAESTVKTGISGFGIETAQKDAMVRMHLKNENGRQDSFNRMVFFLGKKAATYLLRDSSLKAPVTLATKDEIDNPSLVFNSDSQLTGFELSKVETEGSGDYCFYGVSLEKRDAPGVLYHTIGVNGAHFEQYTNNELFWEQLSALHGDLFIVSLGTNEAQSPHLDQQSIVKVCELFVDRIRKIAPGAAILITTLAGSYNHRHKPNPVLLTVSEGLKHFCELKNLPYWDLYSISGGKNSAAGFRKNGMLGHDLIHYTEGGYRLQGQLLLASFAKGYNNYLKFHPFQASQQAPGNHSKKQATVLARKKVPAQKPSPSPTAAKPSMAGLKEPVTPPPSDSIPPHPPRKSKIKVKYEE